MTILNYQEELAIIYGMFMGLLLQKLRFWFLIGVSRRGIMWYEDHGKYQRFVSLSTMCHISIKENLNAKMWFFAADLVAGKLTAQNSNFINLSTAEGVEDNKVVKVMDYTTQSTKINTEE